MEQLEPVEPLSPVSAPDSVADGLDHQLDPRVIPLQRIGGVIVTTLVALGSLVALGLSDEGFTWLRLAGWLAIVAFLSCISYFWPPRAYRHTSYRVDDEGIAIRKGVYWRVVINVPRSRVQHTDVSQGPVERRYGLGTLVIYTAGTDHAKVELAGLEHGRAMRIREHLLPSGASDAV